jgi:Phage integrase family
VGGEALSAAELDPAPGPSSRGTEHQQHLQFNANSPVQIHFNAVAAVRVRCASLHLVSLEGRLTVREAFVRGQFQTPKSRKSMRTFELGRVIVQALNEQWQDTAYRADTDLIFCHTALGSPLDPSKLSRVFLRPAATKAGITKPFRVFHDLRHTAITHDAAAGNPQAYVQMKAGHSQGTITERYIHAAAVMFPGAANKTEARLFGAVEVES